MLRQNGFRSHNTEDASHKGKKMVVTFFTVGW